LRQNQALIQLSDELANQLARDLDFVGQGIRSVARTVDYNIEQTGMLLNYMQTLYRQP